MMKRYVIYISTRLPDVYVTNLRSYLLMEDYHFVSVPKYIIYAWGNKS